MKAFRKIICLIAILLTVTMLFACNCAGGDGQTDSQNATENGATEGNKTEVDTTGKFSIFMNNEYVCRVICPDKPTDAERSIYQNVRERLKLATKVNPGMVTDFKAYNDTGADREKPAILVGKTNYEESKQVYDRLGYGEARIEIIGNKLVIAFSTAEEGERILQKFRSLIKSKDGYVSINSDAIENFFSNELLSTLPKYPFGESSATDFGDGSYMIYAEKSTAENLEAYKQIFIEKGFKPKESNQIKGNVFETLTSEDEYVYMYYSAYDTSLRAIGGPIDRLAESSYDLGLEETYTPCIASVTQHSDGEGYVIRIPDGRFIIFDGGYSGRDRVYKTLRRLEEGNITIAAWIISHPHGDHYPAFVDFITAHGSDADVKIERVMFNYTQADYYNINGTAGVEKAGKNVTELYNKINEFIPDVPVLKIHTGQTITFGSASVEVLYTIDDHLPAGLNNVNDSSTVVRVNAGGKSIMLLADTCYASGPILNNLWGDHLKSDIVQIAHHGCWPSVADIYHSIQGEIVLFPAMTANAKVNIFDSRWSGVMQVVLGYAKDIYISGDKFHVIELPYEIQNNKEEELAKLQ